ncbi:M48 family metallopeptidase [Chamaesiphon sp. OTE_20_metabat_361]|uniref:M48 family metallopeptidase n=1 Tax=Chamaesiphon sp. OTE_20_metabat_361 TaxID=2964689 RepID=UPI00286A0F67|nr:M48 family metallopeptidase [Chamaesiphon sp. OTE_20_metabat_361]
MFARVASLRLWLRRQWLYPWIGALTVAIVIGGQPLVARSADLIQFLAPLVQYVQLSNVSDAQEISLGADTNRALLNDKVKIYQNSAANSYVDRIGQRLARNSGRPNLKYTFQVVEDDNVNAFATMGGFVYVNTGLLKAADNEAQLAGVMGHEIGHITGRHSLQRLKQATVQQGIGSLVGVDRNQIAQIAAQVAFTLPNSRNDEYDADKRGLGMMIQSGYAPTGMPEFLKKLARGNSTPEFLNTHPGASERVSRLQGMIPNTYRNRTEGLSASAYKQNLRSFF